MMAPFVRSVVFISSLVIAWGVWPGEPAQAQGSSAGQATAAEPDVALGEAERRPVPGQIEEITVTARKVEENIQDVPIAVTGFTADQIDRLFARDLSDIGARSPNMIFGRTEVTQAGAIVYIRGVGNSEVERTGDQGVLVQLDGVVLGPMAGSALDTFDIERIEVIRGPQGTLFGRNSIGGVVNVMRTRPTGELGLKGKMTFGKYERADYQMVLNLPVLFEDKLALKLGWLSLNDDGPHKSRIFDDTGPDKDQIQLTGTALFKPTDNQEWLFTWERHRDRGDSGAGWQFTMSAPPGTIPPVVRESGLIEPHPGEVACRGIIQTNPAFVEFFGPTFEMGFGYCNDPYHPNTGSLDNNNRHTARLDIEGYTLQGDIDLRDNLTLTTITAYRDMDEDTFFDVDASPATILHSDRPQEYTQFSQELRLSGRLFDGRLGHTTGLYYWHNDHKIHQTTTLNLSAFTGIPPGVLWPLEATAATRNKATQETEAWAIFGHYTFDITDSLTATVGGRWTKEEKDYRGCQPVSTDTYPFDATTGEIRFCNSDKEAWREFTPKYGLDYRATDDLLFYASYSHGFRSGGYNGRNFEDFDIGPYDPERVRSWEFGLKSDWLDRRLRVNLAYFDNDYIDKQETVITLSRRGIGTSTVVENAADAFIRGFEVEVITTPIPGLTLGGTYSWLSSEYEEYMPFTDTDGDNIPDSFVDRSGDDVSASPEYGFSAFAEYRIPVPLWNGELRFNADYRYLDAVVSAVSADPRVNTLSAPFINIGAGYDFEIGGRGYGVELFVRNLKDEMIPGGGVYNPPLFGFNGLGPGRNWGVNLYFDL